jgi:hypothetical protein
MPVAAVIARLCRALQLSGNREAKFGSARDAEHAASAHCATFPVPYCPNTACDDREDRGK